VSRQCLHRFCTTCIDKSLRLSKKECPSCRVHLPSRRSLRADRNFDGLIRAIYPDLDKLEELEAQRVATITANSNRRALSTSIEEGLRRQAQLSRGVRCGTPRRCLES